MYLIEEDMGVVNLIDLDFMFFNCKFVEYYGIEGIEGEEMCKVEFELDSVCGGIFIYVFIVKVIVNGMVIMFVKWGNFVFINLFGLLLNLLLLSVGLIEFDICGMIMICEIFEKY